MSRTSTPSSPLSNVVRPFIKRANPSASPSVNAVTESFALDAERRLAFIDEAERVAVVPILAGLLKIEQDGTDVYGMVRAIAARVAPDTVEAFNAVGLEVPDADASAVYGYLDVNVNAAFALGLAIGRRLEGGRS